MTTAALIVVGIFGAILLVTGVAWVIRPDHLLGTVTRVWRSPAGLPAAVGIRLFLGVALLLSASASALPGLFTVLGWLSLAGALLVLLGRSWVDRILDWLSARNTSFLRIPALLAALIGGALVYGVIPAF